MRMCAPSKTAKCWAARLRDIEQWNCRTESKSRLEWHSPITAESDQMKAALLLVAFGLRSHVEGILVPNDIPPSRKKREKGGATPKLGIRLKRWASPQSKIGALWNAPNVFD